MAMNPGLQAYKNATKGKKTATQEKKASATKTTAKAAATSKAVPAKATKGSKKATVEETVAIIAEATVEIEAELATAEAVTVPAVEEEILAKEIAAEVEADAKQTSTLVKEDLTPVNRTREQLIVEYASLIKFIAQKIAARLPANVELDDLMSSGVIGLMDAIEKYDSGRDNKFKTYAEFRIRGAILDELRAQDWVPRSVREKAKQLERIYTRIEQQKGRQATDEEVCEELGMSQPEFHDLLSEVRGISLLSFDDISNLSKTDKRSLHGYGDTGSKVPTPFSEVTHAYLKNLISEAITDLPEKQRLVLSLYYYEDLNLKEIGKVLDVTESRVSQLHTQAVLKLKARLKTHWDEFVQLMG